MRFEKAVFGTSDAEFVDQVRQKLAIPGNDPVDVSEARLESIAPSGGAAVKAGAER